MPESPATGFFAGQDRTHSSSLAHPPGGRSRPAHCRPPSLRRSSSSPGSVAAPGSNFQQQLALEEGTELLP